jgi:hypothetical protein
MVTPAIAGIALVGGVPDTVYSSNIVYYNYYYYWKERQFPVRNTDEARIRAIQKGYSKLIEYQWKDGKLEKKTFNLTR